MTQLSWSLSQPFQKKKWNFQFKSSYFELNISATTVLVELNLFTYRVVHAVKNNFVFRSNLFWGKWLGLLFQKTKKLFMQVFLSHKIRILLNLSNFSFLSDFFTVSKNLSQRFQITRKFTFNLKTFRQILGCSQKIW